MSETVGRLNDPAQVRRLVLDDAVFTYVVDGVTTVSTDGFFPSVPARYWAEHTDALDSRQRVVMSTGGLLIERAGHRVMIDAGLGDLSVDTAAVAVQTGTLLDVMSAIGVDPSDIDTLAFTHLHADHTGWAFTHTADGKLAKTFPNAGYLLSAQEWQPFPRGERPVGAPPHDTFIEPLAEVRTLIGDGEEIAPGVVAIVTPGHSAGHTSYLVTTNAGKRLIAFGDVFHTPIQITRPDWCSSPDVDAAGVLDARARVLDELTQLDTFGFGVHFGDQPFGRVARPADGQFHWSPTPSSTIMSAP